MDRYRDIYKKMDKKHPILTSSDDSIFAVMLALTEKPVDQIIDEMEECFNYLKKEIKLNVGANEFQGLGEILALTDGDMKEKCDTGALMDASTISSTVSMVIAQEIAIMMCIMICTTAATTSSH